MRPDPPLQFNGISLYPAEDGGVVHLDAAILQHEFEVAIADREHQIPSDPLALPFHPAAPDGTFGKSRPHDHLSGKLPTFESPILPCLCRPWSRCHATACTEPVLPHKDGVFLKLCVR
jgi:hypothetical protein